MKYIIDIPDEKTYAYINDEKTFLRMPISLGENEIKSMFAPTMLRIKPYTEPDRKAIEDEVWEFASMLMNMHPDVAGDIYWSMNGGKGIGVAAEMTYQEAKTKYEAWKKSKEEIRVGDEVQYSLAGYEYTFIVLGKENDTLYGIRSDCKDGLDDVYDGWDTCNKSDHTLVKTGRHFDEVEKLLERMKAE